MVVLYTTASCGSCRKAKAWLEENQIDYTEKKYRIQFYDSG